MMEVMEEKEHYLDNFSRSEKGLPGSASLQRLRKSAIARFAELGFPTVHDEEWRFTNLAPLVKVPFQLVDGDLDGARSLRPDQLTFDTGECHCLTFVNGQFAPTLSTPGTLPAGIRVTSLGSALTEHPDRLEPFLAHYADYRSQSFPALNTAFFRDGAFVRLERGTVVAKPIHLRFLSVTPGEPTVSHPRTLILAGVNSQATIIESYGGPEGDVYFTNAVTEIVLEENAVLDHYKLQRESTEAFHVATMQIQQGRGTNFTTQAVMLGGGLVRNDVNAVLGAEGCECTLNGLYLASGRQHTDTHTRIDHANPRCASHELYKGILDGRAHGVFNGKIYVHQDAQKTDAKQTNKTLLLSEDAVIDTKPQLEIYADDVKCTHGATIGQLADEAIFYLRSRGIGRQEARSLLTFAFANDVISRIKIQPIRSQLEKMLLAQQHLPGGREVGEAEPS
jgi:Fe-S cluster assembly protein SufD